MTNAPEPPNPRYTPGPSGDIPAYAARVEQLLVEAHRLLRIYATDGAHADADTERWLDRYALHVNQTDTAEMAVVWTREVKTWYDNTYDK